MTVQLSMRELSCVVPDNTPLVCHCSLATAVGTRPVYLKNVLIMADSEVGVSNALLLLKPHALLKDRPISLKQSQRGPEVLSLKSVTPIRYGAHPRGLELANWPQHCGNLFWEVDRQDLQVSAFEGFWGPGLAESADTKSRASCEATAHLQLNLLRMAKLIF